MSRDFHLPKWLMLAYITIAVALGPWIAFLAYSLPARHVSRHWDLVWVGFDLLLFLTLCLTIWLATKRSGWVALSGMSLSTLLVIDAWFDILTSRPLELTAAMAFAFLAELPLAVASLWLTIRVTRQLIARAKVQ